MTTRYRFLDGWVNAQINGERGAIVVEIDRQNGAKHLDARYIEANSVLFGHHVHQATGMVAEQANCSLTVAVALIVGHAKQHRWSIDQTARNVVDRCLRFD